MRKTLLIFLATFSTTVLGLEDCEYLEKQIRTSNQKIGDLQESFDNCFTQLLKYENTRHKGCRKVLKDEKIDLELLKSLAFGPLIDEEISSEQAHKEIVSQAKRYGTYDPEEITLDDVVEFRAVIQRVLLDVYFELSVEDFKNCGYNYGRIRDPLSKYINSGIKFVEYLVENKPEMLNH